MKKNLLLLLQTFIVWPALLVTVTFMTHVPILIKNANAQTPTFQKGQKITIYEKKDVRSVNPEPIGVTYKLGSKQVSIRYGQRGFILPGGTITVVGISQDDPYKGQALLRYDIAPIMCERESNAAPPKTLFFMSQGELSELKSIQDKREKEPKKTTATGAQGPEADLVRKLLAEEKLLSKDPVKDSVKKLLAEEGK